jgi:hypothetical protein
MRTSVCTLLAALWLLPLAAAAHASAAKQPDYLIYSGQLRDESSAALAGIYPLTFALHRDDKSPKKLWFEQQWVAVEDGVYTVELGRERPLPRGFEPASTYVSVSLTGGGELIRERLSERNLPGGDGVGALTAEQPGPPPTPGVTAPRPAGGAVEYAEKAGLAFEAEHAATADRVGNLSLEQLDARYKRKESGARLGTAQRTSGAVGGDGGRPFRLVCPKGYVAIGIQGAAGKLIDSLEVICAPLE